MERIEFQPGKTPPEKATLREHINELEDLGLPADVASELRKSVEGEHISAAEQRAELETLKLLSGVHNLEDYKNERSIDGINQTPDHYFPDTETAYEVARLTYRTDEQNRIFSTVRQIAKDFGKPEYHTQVVATQSEVIPIKSKIESNSVEWIAEVLFVPHKLLGDIAGKVVDKAKKKGAELNGHSGRNIVVIDVRGAFFRLGITLNRLQRAFDRGFFPSLDAVMLLVNDVDKDRDSNTAPALVTVSNPKSPDIPNQDYEILKPDNPVIKQSVYLPAARYKTDIQGNFRKRGQTLEFDDVRVENPLITEWMMSGFIYSSDSNLEAVEVSRPD